jgi:hypothetical protein
VEQRLNAAGLPNPRVVPDDTIALMRELARLMPDCEIARLLNRIGISTEMVMLGRGTAYAFSAIATRLRDTTTANGLSAARSRSKTLRKLSGYAI